MNPVQSAGKSAKSLAQQIARQMAQEPLEVLKDVKSQVTGAEGLPTQERGHQSQSTEPSAGPEFQKRQEEHDKLSTQRRMEALNRELEDMHKQSIFKDLQEKISAGEDVSVEEYSELSMEQKQVLNAQKEAVQKQIEAQRAQGTNVLFTPTPKRSRKMGSSQKQEAEKQQQRVEKPVPPSG